MWDRPLFVSRTQLALQAKSRVVPHDLCVVRRVEPVENNVPAIAFFQRRRDSVREKNPRALETLTGGAGSVVKKLSTGCQFVGGAMKCFV